MGHSVALESHANERIDRIEKLLEASGKPKTIAVFLKCNPHGSHHEVEVHLISKDIKADVHTTNPDIYKALDEAMHKITEAIKKSRGKIIHDSHHAPTPKTQFYKKD